MLEIQPSPRQQIAARCLRVLVVMGIAAFAAACSQPVEGQLVSSGKPLGDFSLDLQFCASGAHDRFPGVILVPAQGEPGGIAVVQDRKRGDHIFVEVPDTCDSSGENCDQIKLDKSQCSTFDLVLKQSADRVNGIRPISGSVDMVCEMEEGGRAEIHATFEECG